MNHDTPQTSAERIAELEQQLRLADEGVSRLAQRCLELEQKLLVCQTELSKNSAETDAVSLLLPQLFYDSGYGFSPRECLTVTEDCYNELTHEISATFVLPTDAQALRLDPGELACCVIDLDISDERLRCHATSGIELPDGCHLFGDSDPNYIIETSTSFPAGMRFAVNYRYYPLGSFAQEQPGRAVLQALNCLKKQKAADAQESAELLAHSRSEIAALRQELEQTRAEYQNVLEGMQHSTSWRLTAPLRRLMGLFRHDR